MLVKFQKLKTDMDRVRMLHWGHFGLLFLGLFIELFYLENPFTHFCFMIFMVGFYRFFFMTIEKLYYTFWTFSVVGLAYFFYKFFSLNAFNLPPSLDYLYLLAAIILLVEMHILSSPLFYPRVNWWEYDFRYRYDLIIIALLGENKVEGRLNDLRRGAGCIILFDEIEIGESFNIGVHQNDEITSFKVEVMSKREHSPGRGHNYGVKFLLDGPSDQRKLLALTKSWQEEHRIKKKIKLSDEKRSRV